ncbi:MAG: hypothetical protein E7211_08750 [Clostridium lundense]|nr:hypothetical protein [Clostridium lundense]
MDILYNIKKVVIEELDSATGLVKAGGKPINLTCDSEADIDPVVSKGDEKVLRDDNKILAVARTNDLIYGYDLKLTNNTFDVGLAALIEGGTIRYDDLEPTKIVGYDAPMLADGDTKIKEFKTTMYIANYEGDAIKNYVKLTLNKCIGEAPKMSFKKDFYAPEFTIKARENTKARLTVKSIDYVDSLPA